MLKCISVLFLFFCVTAVFSYISNCILTSQIIFRDIRNSFGDISNSFEDISN